MFTLEATVAAISYVLLALLVGSLVTSALLLNGEEPATLRRQLGRAALALASAFLVTHLFSLVVQGAKLSGGNLPSADI